MKLEMWGAMEIRLPFPPSAVCREETLEENTITAAHGYNDNVMHISPFVLVVCLLTNLFIYCSFLNAK